MKTNTRAKSLWCVVILAVIIMTPMTSVASEKEQIKRETEDAIREAIRKTDNEFMEGCIAKGYTDCFGLCWLFRESDYCKQDINEEHNEEINYSTYT